jgi:hypothetical protein
MDDVVDERLAVDPGLRELVHSGAGPQFLLIGAAKSGTTSLWAYLQQHPQVFLPDVKEPNPFPSLATSPPLPGPVAPEEVDRLLHTRTVLDPHAYLRLLGRHEPGVVAGEASVRYLYVPTAAARILAAVPDVRLVAVLREPVARLVSHYEMNVASGLEPLGLAAALDAEDERVAAGWGWDWHYTRVGRYGEQLERYRPFLESGQLLVLEYASFRDRPLEVYAAVCRHLGVSTDVLPDMSRRSKEASRARSRMAERVVSSNSLARVRRWAPRGMTRAVAQRLRTLNRAPRTEVPPPLAAELAGRFLDDISHAEDLLGHSLPSLRLQP